MTYAENELPFLPHRVDKLHRDEVSVVRFGKLLGSSVQSSSEAISDCQQTRHQARNQVLACACAHDGIVRTGNSRTVVSRHHEAVFDKAGGVARKTTLKPQEAEDASNAEVVFEDARDWNASVQQLLTALVTNTRHE